MKKRLYASGIASAIAMVLSYLVALAVPELGLPQAVGVGLTVLAVLCFGWFIVEEVRLVRALDELQRRIQLEALAIAYPLAILLIVTLGLLERVGVSLPVGNFSYRHIWPFLIVFYFLGLAIARSRYLALALVLGAPLMLGLVGPAEAQSSGHYVRSGVTGVVRQHIPELPDHAPGVDRRRREDADQDRDLRGRPLLDAGRSDSRPPRLP